MRFFLGDYAQSLHGVAHHADQPGTFLGALLDYLGTTALWGKSMGNGIEIEGK